MLKRQLGAIGAALAATALLAATATAQVEVRDPVNGYELCPEVTESAGVVEGGCEIELTTAGTPRMVYEFTGMNPNWPNDCYTGLTARVGGSGELWVTDFPISCPNGGWWSEDLPWHGQIDPDGDGGFNASIPDVAINTIIGPIWHHAHGGNLVFSLQQHENELWSWTTDDDPPVVSMSGGNWRAWLDGTLHETSNSYITITQPE